MRLEFAELRHLAPVLAGALREVLQSGMFFLILEVDTDQNYFAQFMPTGTGGLYCEVVSDEFLTPEHRLGGEAQGLLISLGWSSPCPNHAMDWPAPVPVDLVAKSVVRTLRQVYGVLASARFRSSLGRRTERPDDAANFVVEACWPASSSPVHSFGMGEPEQPVFKVRGLSSSSVNQLLALVPEERLAEARRIWDANSSEPVAGVAQDLTWALPLPPGVESLPIVALQRIADLGDLGVASISQVPPGGDSAGQPGA